MGLSRTEIKVLETYPERFDDRILQYDAPDSSKYGLYTKASTENCTGRCVENRMAFTLPSIVITVDVPARMLRNGTVECVCAISEVFSLCADDAATLRKGANEMRNCDCCGSWFQG